MVSKFVCHLVRLCAYSVRMTVIAAGSILLTRLIMDWEHPDWRYYSVQGLILAAYASAAAVEFLAGLAAKTRGSGRP